MPSCQVFFAPLNRRAVVETGTTLFEAAAAADLMITGGCGGQGLCRRCKMIVKEGKVRNESAEGLTVEEVQAGFVLACQSHLQGDLLVEIPPVACITVKTEADQDARRFRAIQPTMTQKTQKKYEKSPVIRKIFFQLDPPTLEDDLGDQERLRRALKQKNIISPIHADLKLLRRIPGILRKNNFAVTVTLGAGDDRVEIMDVEGGDRSRWNYAAVVDVGTTTIVVHLVHLADLTTLDAQACYNSQSAHGMEVTARIMAAEKKGEKQLQKVVAQDINRLISTLAEKNGIGLKDITAVVAAGNTTMMHFLLGLPARNIRRKPYIAASLAPLPCRAAEARLKIHPNGLLWVSPSISSWVGGDLTAGILATGLHEMDETALLIDVGTNGEIVLGNKEWLVACSASTGPALEGASVECGMIAERGAIERVCLENERFRYKIIGDTEPAGLCGSGMIDLMAALLERGIIDRKGQFVEGADPAVKFKNGRGRFVIAESGKTGSKKEVFVTQDDIDRVITAKAAVFAATKILVERLNLGFHDIKKLFLAGGFGGYIDRGNAIKIGLLPDLPLSCIHYVGNTSLEGAKLAAFSHEARRKLDEIRRRTTCYDLIGAPDYVEQFKQAMFLPHTDIELFPSLHPREANAA